MAQTIDRTLVPLMIAYGMMVIAQMKGESVIGFLWGDGAKNAIENRDCESVEPNLEVSKLCEGYAAAHFDPSSNILHAAGMFATLILTASVVRDLLSSTKSKQRISTLAKTTMWIPPVYYLPAWFGHFGFQKDIPAVFTYGTTVYGYLKGEFCSWKELLTGGTISSPMEIMAAILLSYLMSEFLQTATCRNGTLQRKRSNRYELNKVE